MNDGKLQVLYKYSTTNYEKLACKLTGGAYWLEYQKLHWVFTKV